jgi:hypothetical protein
MWTYLPATSWREVNGTFVALPGSPWLVKNFDLDRDRQIFDRKGAMPVICPVDKTRRRIPVSISGTVLVSENRLFGLLSRINVLGTCHMIKDERT